MNLNRRLAASFAVLFLETACATVTGGPAEGVIIDADSHAPLPSAFVIAQWSAMGSAAGVHSRSLCPRVQVVQADANGHFRLPEANAFLTPGGIVDIFGYHKGYKFDYDESLSKKAVLMRRFVGTDDQRAESIQTYSSLLMCGRTEDTIRVLLPLFQAIDDEVTTLKLSKPHEGPRRTLVESLHGLEETLEREKKSHQQTGGVSK